MILRLPIQVHLFDASGQLVQSINSTKKSQVRLRVHDFPREGWIFGTCKVWYNKPEDYYNEFGFTNIAQLDHGLTVSTEKELVDFFKSIIPGHYLEKRKLSAAQKLAIAKARRKSSMGAKV